MYTSVEEGGQEGGGRGRAGRRSGAMRGREKRSREYILSIKEACSVYALQASELLPCSSPSSPPGSSSGPLAALLAFSPFLLHLLPLCLCLPFGLASISLQWTCTTPLGLDSLRASPPSTTPPLGNPPLHCRLAHQEPRNRSLIVLPISKTFTMKRHTRPNSTTSRLAHVRG